MQIPPQPEPYGLPKPQETTSATAESRRVEVKAKPELPHKVHSWVSEMYVATLLVATFAVDQITKGWVKSHLQLGESIPTQGFFRITHTFNTGSAFGLFPDQTVILTAASVVGIGILLLFLRKQPIRGAWLYTSLGLQLGGAAGNLVDRLTMGRVTDFIHIGIWPVFNLADSSIVIGLIILAWLLFRSPKETPAAIQETQHVPSQEEAAQASGLLPNNDPGSEERP